MSDIAGKFLYAYKRIREPSSLSAISSMLVLLGVNLPPETFQTVMNFLAVVFGLAGVFVKEGKPETTVDGF